MTAVVETYELAPGYSISRVIRGGWQLAGGHGAIDRDRAVDDLIAAFDAGVFTFDCADIYTGVEELYGAMRARLIAPTGPRRAPARPPRPNISTPTTSRFPAASIRAIRLRTALMTPARSSASPSRRPRRRIRRRSATQ